MTLVMCACFLFCFFFLFLFLVKEVWFYHQNFSSKQKTRICVVQLCNNGLRLYIRIWMVIWRLLHILLNSKGFIILGLFKFITLTSIYLKSFQVLDLESVVLNDISTSILDLVCLRHVSSTITISKSLQISIIYLHDLQTLILHCLKLHLTESYFKLPCPSPQAVISFPHLSTILMGGREDHWPVARAFVHEEWEVTWDRMRITWSEVLAPWEFASSLLESRCWFFPMPWACDYQKMQFLRRHS